MIARLAHAAMVLLTAASLLVTPVYAQSQGTAPSGTSAPSAQPQGQTAQLPAEQQGEPSNQGQSAAPPVAPVRHLNFGLGRDYSKGPSWLPNIIKPYQQKTVPPATLINTPRIEQLIHNGKLELSLEDAVSLALENNMNIAVQRFTPWLDEANLLLAKSGANGRASFDPLLTSQFTMEQQTTPVNNPFEASGVPCPLGTLCAPYPFVQHYYTDNYGYSQNFYSGTQFQVNFDTNFAAQPARFSFNLFNPYYQSTLGVQITQPLLNGFGKIPNTRYIIEAKNTVRVGESQLAQQVMATVAQTSNDYWELVYALENVSVEQTAVKSSNQLYEDNKKQLAIGTMAPLDVITAQSQLATDQQNLIIAQTIQLQDETVLLNDITKDPLAEPLRGVEIVPTTAIFTPDVTEDIPIQDAVNEAWKKRPEIQQAEMNLKNAGVEIKATKNALLPQLSIFGLFQETGLGGTGSACVANCGFFSANKQVVYFPVGLGYGLDNMINNNYPTYEGGLNLTLPIRNRAAQAANATAQLNERQQETSYRQLQNTIVLAVRNAMIALQQDRATVAASDEARVLAQQTYVDEKKKYELGSSTAYNVVLRERDMIAAEGTELRARINLIEAAVAFNQAMGRTLDVHNITLADALRGSVSHAPAIPGDLSMDAQTGH